MTLADDAPLSSKPYFTRGSFRTRAITTVDAAQFGTAGGRAAGSRGREYSVEGVPVEARETVQRREAQLPYGYVMRELRVVPAIAVTSSPTDGRRAGARAEQDVQRVRSTS